MNGLRERLERVPMIKSATVRKLYPNELVVTLTEREAHAIWQLNGELFVIAADGTVIDLMQDERYLDLPLVVGEGANTPHQGLPRAARGRRAAEERVRAGTLVAGRRWTLKMDNGMDVRLPELGAADALARLVKLEREQKILEKDVLAIDLRMADRVVVRLTEEAALARAEALKKSQCAARGRYMSLSRQGLTPRLKPLSARKSAILSVLDIGTSKVVCVVAELQPADEVESLRGRTHLARILGIGHQRSVGLKGGVVVDLEAAESRDPSGGPCGRADGEGRDPVGDRQPHRRTSRLGAFRGACAGARRGRPGDDASRARCRSEPDLRQGRAVLHALPTGFSLDAQNHIVDPPA